MIASETARNVLNFLLFQAGWFACVFYPGLIGAGVVVVFLILHFVLVSQNRVTELQFIGLGTVVGSVLDGIWFQTGTLDDGTGQVMLTPPWLVAELGHFHDHPEPFSGLDQQEGVAAVRACALRRPIRLLVGKPARCSATAGIDSLADRTRIWLAGCFPTALVRP